MLLKVKSVPGSDQVCYVNVRVDRELGMPVRKWVKQFRGERQWPFDTQLNH